MILVNHMLRAIAACLVGACSQAAYADCTTNPYEWTYGQFDIDPSNPVSQYQKLETTRQFYCAGPASSLWFDLGGTGDWVHNGNFGSGSRFVHRQYAGLEIGLGFEVGGRLYPMMDRTFQLIHTGQGSVVLRYEIWYRPGVGTPLPPGMSYIPGFRLRGGGDSSDSGLAPRLTFGNPSTCTLANVNQALKDIQPTSLSAVGATVDAAADFTMSLNCTLGAARPIRLTLTDASNAANTGEDLSPASGSTASGVRLQLLRNGVPVRMGANWTQRSSDAAPAFGVRYKRVGALSPGSVNARAILRLDHL
ncbi:hypothetical protein [Pseudoxanthomonas sp.]|jgi:hypothetical protein|uniref:fimbrial protein n=1 Tax=Pseudoxanthomonas sp. TaxID=1871049 RepID=UPI002E155C4F|nr:hypothetical protein [Pseudoxanthomonas sp.]